MDKTIFLGSILAAVAIGTILSLTDLPEAAAPQMAIDMAQLNEKGGKLMIRGDLVGLTPIDGNYKVFITIFDPNDPQNRVTANTDLKITGKQK